MPRKLSIGSKIRTNDSYAYTNLLARLSQGFKTKTSLLTLPFIEEERLQFAARCNDHVLSDEEMAQVRLLRRSITNALSSFRLDAEPLLEHERKHYNKCLDACDVALAPHKRLPLELLTLIFYYCITSDELWYTSHNGPQLTCAPFLLGRICSRWRKISRNDPCLWAEVHLDVTRERPSTLGHICKSAPPCAHISVAWHYTDIDFKTVLLPHLWRIQSLWLVLSPTQLDKVFKSISKSSIAFSNIESLSIGFRPPVFGTIDDWTAASWDSLAPFKDATHLRKFTLTSPHFVFPYPSLHLPWSQLHTVKIVNADPTQCVEVVKRCSAVEHLHLEFSLSSPDIAKSVSMPVTFASTSAGSTLGHLKTLVGLVPPPLANKAANLSVDSTLSHLKTISLAGHVPPLLVDPLVGSTSLQSLDIRSTDVDGDMLYVLLAGKQSLKSIYTSVPKPPQKITCLDLHLPELRKLELRGVCDNWLFHLLMPLSLQELEISDPKVDLDLIAICNMVASSASCISTLVLGLHGGENLSFLFRLLSVLAMAENVSVPGAALSNRCINGIADGSLLPRLKRFSCETRTDIDFFYMVEGRMRATTRLERVEGVVLDYELSEEDRGKRLKSLRNRSYKVFLHSLSETTRTPHRGWLLRDPR